MSDATTNGMQYRPELSTTPEEERDMEPDELVCVECGRYSGTDDYCVYCG